MTVDLVVFRSDRFQLHDTGPHPENAGRLRAIDRRLEAAGLYDRLTVVEPEPATERDVELVHDPHYVRSIEEITVAGGGMLDPDTTVSENTYDVALLAVGASLAAVDRVLDGDARRVFVLPRPPGHHAEPGRGMGFCIFNNVAIAARHAINRRGLRRVAILDWDVHHGNGTQAAFYDTDAVLFISLHQYGWMFYPGTGAVEERGRGRGAGYNLNLPLREGLGDDAYLKLFDDVVGPTLAAYRPELLLVSAGYDAHAADPLAEMNVSSEGFRQMARRARVWADQLIEGRLVGVLEGGYNGDALAEGVELTIREWADLDLEDE